MASIKRYTSVDGVDTWRVRFRLQGRSCSKTFRKSEAAEVFGEMLDRWGPVQALEFVNEPTQPKRLAAGSTVGQAIERYIEQRRKLVTRKVYRTIARLYINPTLGDIRTSRLTKEAVQDWANGLTVSGQLIKNIHSVLNGALEMAKDKGEIHSNPARRATKSFRQGIVLPRVTQERPPVFLSDDEYALVIKCVPEHYQLFVEFLAATGCRIGEAIALTPADINLRTGKVRIWKTRSLDENNRMALGNTKTEASDREIAVPKHILDKLDLSGEFIFTNTEGNPINSASFRTNVWRFAMQRTGLPKQRVPRIHDLRHTHASWLLEAGVSPYQVQRRLGHATVTTTLNTYGHPSDDGDQKILGLLSRLAGADGFAPSAPQ